MSELFRSKTPEPQKLPETKVVRMPVADDPNRLAARRRIMEARRGRASTRLALGSSKLGSGGTGVT